MDNPFACRTLAVSYKTVGCNGPAPPRSLSPGDVQYVECAIELDSRLASTKPHFGDPAPQLSNRQLGIRPIDSRR